MTEQKKIAIMQPYLFPYVGYFQLINAVDEFVIFDDVNFIKRGWINRNNILESGEPRLLTFPMKGISQNKKINEIEFDLDDLKTQKILKGIELNYQKAPMFEDVFLIIERILRFENKNSAKLIGNSIIEILDYLGIEKQISYSSSIKKNNSLKGESKIISICEALRATHYINPSGGLNLYSSDSFENANIALQFLKSRDIQYDQKLTYFVPNLSIIDLMMFNSKDQLISLLDAFDLIKANS